MDGIKEITYLRALRSTSPKRGLGSVAIRANPNQVGAVV